MVPVRVFMELLEVVSRSTVARPWQGEPMTDPRSSTVDQIVHRSAARTPDRVALTYADRSWTYAELDAAVSRAAAHLLSLGLSHGDRVATVGANSDAYLLAFLGCARAGLVHVPVNYALTGRELAYVLAQSGSRVALVDPALRDGRGGGARPDRRSSRCCTLHGDDDAVLPTWADGRRPRRRQPRSPTPTWCSCSTPRARPGTPRAR